MSDSDSDTEVSSSSNHESGHETPQEAGSPDNSGGIEDIDPPVNHGSLPRFELMVHLFEGLESTTGQGSTIQRRRILAEFIHDWRKKVGNDIYPAFQLLLPYIDRELNQLFKLKEKALGRLLVPALGIPRDSSDAKALLAPSGTGGSNKRWGGGHSSAHSLGFSATAFDLIERRNPRREYSSISIGEVTDRLKELADARRERQILILKSFYNQMNSLELKWILRIIMRNMHINCSHRTILHIWHPDALAVYNVSHDLKTTCHLTYDPNLQLAETEKSIKPMHCFKPQRSRFVHGVIENFDKVRKEMHQEIEKELQREISADEFYFYIEEKIDGERMQLHWTEGGKVCRYFSRKGTNYTADYGATTDSEQGSLTPYLKGVLDASVNSCILDGEMVAWDAVHNEVCALTKVKEAAHGRGQWRPMFLVFDCVHLNGKDLSNHALFIRKKVLERLLPPGNRRLSKGRLELLQYQRATETQDIEEAFNQVIARMSEGLVVKSPYSRYIVDGDRHSWIKVKPEYVSGYEDENFDLVVVGGYYGSGQNSQQITSFLMALRDDRKKKRYTNLCRVSNGFCTAMFERVARMTEGKWLPSTQCPDSVKRVGEDMPHAWLDPEQDGLVLEVKATQIVPSARYSSGYSLRFPRFVKFKTDRDGTNCLDVKSFEEYRLSLQEPSTKRKARSTTPNSAPSKKIKLQSAEPQPVTEVSKRFDGLTFYIAGDIRSPQYMLEQDLAALVKSHGGATTRSIVPGAVLVADERLPRISGLIEENRVAIVHPRWIFDSIAAGRQLPLEPDHYFKCPDRRLKQAANGLVDSYGFSLYREQSAADVARHLDAMNISDMFSTQEHEEALECLAEAMPEDHTRGPAMRAWLFVGLFVCVLEDSDKVHTEQLLRFGGAKLVENIDRATHVVCNDRTQWGSLRRPKGPYIVTSTWVERCWSQNSLLDEKEHR